MSPNMWWAGLQIWCEGGVAGAVVGAAVLSPCFGSGWSAGLTLLPGCCSTDRLLLGPGTGLLCDCERACRAARAGPEHRQQRGVPGTCCGGHLSAPPGARKAGAGITGEGRASRGQPGKALPVLWLPTGLTSSPRPAWHLTAAGLTDGTACAVKPLLGCPACLLA